MIKAKKKRTPNILVAVDASEYSKKALGYACMLAKCTDSNLQILNVIEAYVNIGYSITKELEKMSNELLNKYEGKAKSLGIKSIRTLQSKGNPAEEILRTVSKEDIDTVVLGSRGIYSSSREFILGSTAYKLAHYLKCTVIIVK
ncbi:MAG TPA: universal stress protein [Nitrososphaeraceae archaeon]|jgi:nucleotide-binding universal stress UspA family protein